jgi:mono/diheme cytochrome c family protein
MKQTFAIIAASATLLITNGANAADGARVFAENCQACHAEGAMGTPGLAPPLVSTVIANAASRQKDYPELVLLNGLTGSLALDDGSIMAGVMPPQRTLSDDDAAAVVSYLYSLNETKAEITSQDVARLRAKAVSGEDLRRLRKDLLK